MGLRYTKIESSSTHSQTKALKSQQRTHVSPLLRSGSATMAKISIPNIHRVVKKTSTGRRIEYHYVYRGGPRFWDSSQNFQPNSPQYLLAYASALRANPPQNVKVFEGVINSFLQSKEFDQLRASTKRGYRYNIEGKGYIRDKFKSTPLAAFEDRKMRSVTKTWLSKKEPGTARNLLATLQRLLSFAYDEGMIANNALAGMRKPKIQDRSSITWTKEEIQLMKLAPLYVYRILIVTLETGLRPSDSFRLRRSDFLESETGELQIRIRTSKSNFKTQAVIPVTPEMRRIFDDTPPDQDTILISGKGSPFKVAAGLGVAVGKHMRRLGIKRDLRLYDARGNAATRLLKAGCDIGQIAVVMGWKPDHASAMIARYAKTDPSMASGVLQRFKDRGLVDDV